jgi:hypothetical protein
MELELTKTEDDAKGRLTLDEPDLRNVPRGGRARTYQIQEGTEGKSNTGGLPMRSNTDEQTRAPVAGPRVPPRLFNPLRKVGVKLGRWGA